MTKLSIRSCISFLKMRKQSWSFGAFATDQEEMKHLETRVAEMVAERFRNQELEKEVDYQGAENPLEDNRHQAMRYSFVNMKDESELIKQLEFVRLIVDLNSQPLLYTQIAGISAGIPQINRVKTEYVSHKKNGYLLENIADFAQAAALLSRQPASMERLPDSFD